MWLIFSDVQLLERRQKLYHKSQSMFGIVCVCVYVYLKLKSLNLPLIVWLCHWFYLFGKVIASYGSRYSRMDLKRTTYLWKWESLSQFSILWGLHLLLVSSCKSESVSMLTQLNLLPLKHKKIWKLDKRFNNISWN